MSLTGLIFIGLLFVFSIKLKKMHLSRFLGFLLVLSLFLVATGLLPRLLLASLQTQPHVQNPDWKNKNLILVLGGGISQEPLSGDFGTQSSVRARPYEAARLYFLCKEKVQSCTILTSGGDPKGYNISEAQVLAQELQSLKIPARDIMIEDQSHNTFQNAKFSQTLIQDKNYDVIVLVTSATHMLRSQILFNHFHISTLAAPADHLKVADSWQNLSYNFFICDVVLHEYGGLAQYYIYTFLGLNS